MAILGNAVVVLSSTATNNLTGGVFIPNSAVFEMSTLSDLSIGVNESDADIKIFSRDPGVWGNDITVSIALPDSFNRAEGDERYAMAGVKVDDLFEYPPDNDEYAIIVMYKGEVVESWLVSTDQTAKDSNNKSIYSEDVINNKSSYIFIKQINNTITDKTLLKDPDTGVYSGQILELGLGEDPEVSEGSLLSAYEVWSNKEEVDIDIVIGNERDGGVSAKNLADLRKDCIAFIGAERGDVVGWKASDAVSNLVAWRKTGNVNYNNMFVVACGNYKYQYDRYNDKNRWVNIAGDIAGLRAETSTNRASWWASAGLERGQLKNVKKLAFNPNQGQRDILYKNGINPIVAFPGQGTCMWGQKTLLDKPSSFDRVNVRGLFNTLERSLSKMAKYQVMEFNDNFTRNRIISMIKPFLSSVQAGRGIQDFLVICDTTNNTPDVISRNQLVVDVYIKPTYVAEFIHLKFTNAGTNSFSEIIGGA